MSFKRLLIGLLGFFSVSGFGNTIVDIEADALLSEDTASWLILDVRSPAEFESGHVPNAVNIPHTEIADSIDKLRVYTDKPVVVYCRSGFRANKAANILIESGFSQVKHLQGDMKNWETSNHPIEK